MENVHLPALSRSRLPVFLAHAIRFQMFILSYGKFYPIQRHSATDHFRTQIVSVWQKASCDKPVIRQFRLDLGGDDLPFAQVDQLPFRLLAPRMRELWRVDACQDAQTDLFFCAANLSQT